MTNDVDMPSVRRLLSPYIESENACTNDGVGTEPFAAPSSDEDALPLTSTPPRSLVCAMSVARSAPTSSLTMMAYGLSAAKLGTGAQSGGRPMVPAVHVH